MVVVVQLVRTPDCGSGGRRFESGLPPKSKPSRYRGFFCCSNYYNLVDIIKYIRDMKKVKYVKSLFIASIVVSLGAIGWGIYELTNNEFLIGLGFIFGGVAMSWNDLSNLLKKKDK